MLPSKPGQLVRSLGISTAGELGVFLGWHTYKSPMLDVEDYECSRVFIGGKLGTIQSDLLEVVEKTP